VTNLHNLIQDAYSRITVTWKGKLIPHSEQYFYISKPHFSTEHKINYSLVLTVLPLMLMVIRTTNSFLIDTHLYKQKADYKIDKINI